MFGALPRWESRSHQRRSGPSASRHYLATGCCQGFSLQRIANTAKKSIAFATLAMAIHCKTLKFAVPAFCLSTLAAVGSAQAQQVITEWNNGQAIALSPLGSSNSGAFAINDAGQVAGYTEKGGGFIATEWSNGQAIVLNNPAGSTSSGAYALNNVGQLVGYSTLNGNLTATEWSNGQAIVLNYLPGSTFSLANGVNDAGQVVGQSVTNGLSIATEWSNGKAIALGSLPGSRDNIASGINNAGQVVGMTGLTNGNGAPTEWINGKATALGYLPGSTNAEALAINNSGQVAGISWASGDNNVIATEWINGVAIRLGNLAGSATSGFISFAYAINNAGQVVGWDVVSGTAIATEWTNGKAVALSNLAGAVNDGGNFISGAYGINDAGQVVGSTYVAAPTIQFWNGATITATGSIVGGAGTWTAGPVANWTDSAGAISSAWGGNFAVFQATGGSGAAVTVDASAGAVSAAGMQFIGTGWSVNGAPITLNGASGQTTIQVGDGSAAGADYSATIGSVLTGASQLVKTDLGTLILAGANTYNGATEVAAGTLAITGSIASAAQVDSGATLGGSGTVGSIVALSGATIAPGILTPYSTLSSTGAVTFNAGSSFFVNINAAGQHDKLVTAGSATLSGGTVAVAAAAGTYSPLTSYTLLTAAGGISGTFSSLSTAASLAFLSPYLGYDANDVTLRFKQTANFESAAQTPNQIATAGALQKQPVGSPLYNALIGQSGPGARAAFDALSGEIHASTASAAFDDSRLPREAVLDRLADPFGAPPSSAAGFVASSAPVADPLSGNVLTAWGQAFGTFGHIAGDGDAAGLNRSLGGFILGVDQSLDNRYRFGLTGGFTQSGLSLAARGSSGSITSTFLGLYGGATFDALRLRGGALYAFDRFETSRVASVAGAGDTDGSAYGGGTSRPSARPAGAWLWRISSGRALSSLSSGFWRNRSRPTPSWRMAGRRL